MWPWWVEAQRAGLRIAEWYWDGVVWLTGNGTIGF